MNTKAKGSRLERRCMAYYEALGYSCTKSGASLGTFDVIAIGSHDAYLVQSKANRKPSKAEMQRLEQFQCPPFMHKILMIWHDGLPNAPEIIPIARNRPEKEAVEILTHPVKTAAIARTGNPAFCNHANEVPIQFKCECPQSCPCWDSMMIGHKITLPDGASDKNGYCLVCGELYTPAHKIKHPWVP